jgi:hypothetical protein
MINVSQFMVIWYIFWSISCPFGIFCGYLVYMYHFGILYQEKSGNSVGSAKGCQIFLGAMHQHGEKYTKLPQYVYVYQMAIK